MLHPEVTCQVHSAFEMISADLLKEILKFLQNNEHSFLVGLVCKTWNSLISRKHFSVETITNFYASQGNLSCLKWIQYHLQTFVNNN